LFLEEFIESLLWYLPEFSGAFDQAASGLSLSVSFGALDQAASVLSLSVSLKSIQN